MVATGQDVYATLLTSNDYLPGAVVLAHSLRDNGTTKQLVVLVTLDNLQASTIEELKRVYDHVIPVDRIVNKCPANLYLMNRPDLSSTFTKIALWGQTQFRRVVYLDADIVALRAPDELFRIEASLAAVPDIGWPDCFNSGVLVLSPNMGDYYALLALAQRGISFDGADQGLLNMHFRNWERLSFAYNCTPSASYQYVPAYRHFQSTIAMVHYIGHDKPWVVGREAKGSSRVYEELVGRWWSVYAKHHRALTTTTITRNGIGGQQAPWTVQQYVKGEASSTDFGYSSLGISIVLAPDSGPSATSTELPLTEKPEHGESLAQGEVQPVPTAEQRRFTAPMTEWDPKNQPPPRKSRPEASNFPSQTYIMSEDRGLFIPPKAYPEPPKNMWYEVPKVSPMEERPKPLFPWEENQAKPTRVFVEDSIPSPEPAPSMTTEEDPQPEPGSPTTPTIQTITAEPFASYSRSNAWDEMPEIERYITALTQARRGKVQVLTPNPEVQSVLSPGAMNPPQERRPSMRLTDFPTEFERPSLPVTPAPVHRHRFWGEERDVASDLPGAEGVPRQQDWDPMAKLVELQRRQSKVLVQEPQSPTRLIPDRKLPGNVSPVPKSSEEEHATSTTISEETASTRVALSGAASPHGLVTTGMVPAFRDVDYGIRSAGAIRQGVVSPTES